MKRGGGSDPHGQHPYQDRTALVHARIRLKDHDFRRSENIWSATQVAARGGRVHARRARNHRGSLGPRGQRVGARVPGRRPHVETVRALSAALDLSGATRDALMGSARASDQQPPVDGPSGLLPLATTALLGRDDDLHTLRPWLDDSDVRLMTLTGPGGVGKTRLAIEVVRPIATAGESQVVFVSLAAIRNPAFVSPAIADALGLSDVLANDLPRRARAACADRPTLLLLDNFRAGPRATTPGGCGSATPTTPLFHVYEGRSFARLNLWPGAAPRASSTSLDRNAPGPARLPGRHRAAGPLLCWAATRVRWEASTGTPSPTSSGWRGCPPAARRTAGYKDLRPSLPGHGARRHGPAGRGPLLVQAASSPPSNPPRRRRGTRRGGYVKAPYAGSAEAGAGRRRCRPPTAKRDRAGHEVLPRGRSPRRRRRGGRRPRSGSADLRGGGGPPQVEPANLRRRNGTARAGRGTSRGAPDRQRGEPRTCPRAPAAARSRSGAGRRRPACGNGVDSDARDRGPKPSAARAYRYRGPASTVLLYVPRIDTAAPNVISQPPHPPRNSRAASASGVSDCPRPAACPGPPTARPYRSA